MSASEDKNIFLKEHVDSHLVSGKPQLTWTKTEAEATTWVVLAGVSLALTWKSKFRGLWLSGRNLAHSDWEDVAAGVGCDAERKPTWRCIAFCSSNKCLGSHHRNGPFLPLDWGHRAACRDGGRQAHFQGGAELLQEWGHFSRTFCLISWLPSAQAASVRPCQQEKGWVPAPWLWRTKRPRRAYRLGGSRCRAPDEAWQMVAPRSGVPQGRPAGKPGKGRVSRKPLSESAAHCQFCAPDSGPSARWIVSEKVSFTHCQDIHDLFLNPHKN